MTLPLDPAQLQFLAGHHRAAMITVRADGTPHVAQVGVGLVEGPDGTQRLWSSGTQGRLRTRHTVAGRGRRPTPPGLDGPAHAPRAPGASNNGTASGVSWSASFLLSMWRRAGVIRREHAGPGQAPSLRVHLVHDRLECGHLNWPRRRVSGVDGT